MNYPSNKQQETFCNLFEDSSCYDNDMETYLTEEFALNIRLSCANKQELSKLQEKKRGFSMHSSVFIPNCLRKVKAKDIIGDDVIIDS